MNWPPGCNQAIFDMFNETLDDEEVEVIGYCEKCGDELLHNTVVVVNGITFCLDCSEGLRNGDEI